MSTSLLLPILLPISIALAGLGVTEPTADCRLVFVDRTRDLGIDFVHDSGARGEKHLPETMGAGVAWLDYDGDGWLDLYLVQSGQFPPKPLNSSAGDAGRSTRSSAPDTGLPGDRLFRNLGPGADGQIAFADVTDEAGIAQTGYGQGVLAIDIDGDGDTDLVRTEFGGERISNNEGGRFVDGQVLESLPVALQFGDSGTESNVPAWSSSLAASDTDGDGDLDLYVVRYLEFDAQSPRVCLAKAANQTPNRGVEGRSDSEQPEYCDPSLFAGQRDVFYENQSGSAVGSGDQRFLPATEKVGLVLGPEEVVGKGLGALFVDVNDDDRPDLYVANDITPNHLFLNTGSGFRDESLFSGVAVSGAGRAEAGMGLAVLDDDRDGDPDLAVTNFDVETNTLYRNLGEAFFEDASTGSGFGLPSFNLLGFGLLAEDFDLDGWVDTYAANGHIFEQPKRLNVQYRQRDLFLAGSVEGFRELSCAVTAEPKVSRGAASADFDLDGDVDLAVTNVDDLPSILENQLKTGSSWLGVELVGSGVNTEAVGAVVSFRDKGQTGEQVESGSGARLQTRWVVAGGSYLSSSSRQLRFSAVAAAERSEGEPASLQIRWPDGRRLQILNPPDGRILRIHEARE